jgi:hypothetical protein
MDWRGCSCSRVAGTESVCRMAGTESVCRMAGTGSVCRMAGTESVCRMAGTEPTALKAPARLDSRDSHGSLRSPFERLVASLRSVTRSLRASLARVTRSLQCLLRPGSPRRAAPFIPPRRVGHTLPSRLRCSLRCASHPSHGFGSRPFGHASQRAPTWRGESVHENRAGVTVHENRAGVTIHENRVGDTIHVPWRNGRARRAWRLRRHVLRRSAHADRPARASPQRGPIRASEASEDIHLSGRERAEGFPYLRCGSGRGCSSTIVSNRERAETFPTVRGRRRNKQRDTNTATTIEYERSVRKTQ